ncbi:MAG: tetratricopeptide repeat protein, partial [Acidobacteriota bacterium]
QQPVHKDARLLLAHLSAVLGDIEEARGLYEGLLVERAEIDVLHQAAAFYFGPGDDLGRARGCLERLLVRSPKDVDALTRMGRVELAQGRVDAAEAVLQQALAVDPGTREALLLLARISDEIAEDPNQAEHLLRKALKAHPFDPVSHFNLAVHLSRTDQWPEAVRHLERASSFAPGGVFPEAHLALARLHSGRGEEAQARSRLEELLLAVDDAVMIDTARSELASLSDQDSAKNQTNLKEPEKKEGRR